MAFDNLAGRHRHRTIKLPPFLPFVRPTQDVLTPTAAARAQKSAIRQTR
ncbi:hypothetical protein HMPREF1986_02783, partial [Oribacterium sp. oral taxon 078 str. F0263]